MKRLTTDNPQNNFETLLNMVYPGGDGWAYIRHGEDGVPIDDFCLTMCEKHGCNMTDMKLLPHETKDQHLCDCLFDCCPVATVYAALCGYSHIRSRLKMYEDAGMMPPKSENHE